MSDLVGRDAVRYQSSAGVATLTMDQPDTRNALTPELLEGLGAGLDTALADPSVRVVVLTNNGPAFCAGADLSGRSNPAVKPRVALDEVLTTMLDSPKPVLGRVAGHCMGGGVGLAAACDLSVARDGVRFGFTEVRIGVAPAIISVVCLPKLRRGDALDLFLTGERISASRAAEVGLITAAVPEDALDATVADLVAKLTAGGPGALAAAKKLVFDVPGMHRAEAFAWTSELSRSLFASEEAAEGMAAFRDRRPPSWVPPED
jgi:methylglutaconyl-CoA hydratase